MYIFKIQVILNSRKWILEADQRIPQSCDQNSLQISPNIPWGTEDKNLSLLRTTYLNKCIEIKENDRQRVEFKRIWSRVEKFNKHVFEVLKTERIKEKMLQASSPLQGDLTQKLLAMSHYNALPGP